MNSADVTPCGHCFPNFTHVTVLHDFCTGPSPRSPLHRVISCPAAGICAQSVLGSTLSTAPEFASVERGLGVLLEAGFHAISICSAVVHVECTCFFTLDMTLEAPTDNHSNKQFICPTALSVVFCGTLLPEHGRQPEKGIHNTMSARTSHCQHHWTGPPSTSPTSRQSSADGLPS